MPEEILSVSFLFDQEISITKPDPLARPHKRCGKGSGIKPRRARLDIKPNMMGFEGHRFLNLASTAKGESGSILAGFPWGFASIRLGVR